MNLKKIRIKDLPKKTEDNSFPKMTRENIRYLTNTYNKKPPYKIKLPSKIDSDGYRFVYLEDIKKIEKERQGRPYKNKNNKGE